MSRFHYRPPNPNGRFAKFKALMGHEGPAPAPIAKTPVTNSKQPSQTAIAAAKLPKPARPSTVSAESLKKRLAADARIDREIEDAIERKRARDEITNAWETAIKQIAGSTRGNFANGRASVWENAIRQVTGGYIQGDTAPTTIQMGDV